MTKTPEEIEEARRIVAEADAQALHQQAEEIISALLPLTSLGFGVEEAPSVSLSEVARELRTSAMAPGVPQDISMLAFPLAGPLETLNDRIRNVLANAQRNLLPETSEPEAPEPEAPEET